MKQLIIFIITITLLSCNNLNKPKEINDIENVEALKDTILVQIENEIDKSYEIGFYSKSYTYCWIVDKDTLDMKIELKEYKKDNSVSIRVFNREPILLNTTIEKINECLPLIQENFELDNLKSLYFESPIFYKDLTNELSQDYKSQFGQKNITYKNLNNFLMNSWFDKKISNFLNQFDKTTKRYGIEKFHLLDKRYYSEYIPKTDLNEYPEFSIHGMGISVIINE